MAGYIYIVSDPLVDPVAGYFRLNTASPPYTLDIANLDFNYFTVFPLDTTFNQTGQTLDDFCLTFLDPNGQLLMMIWINANTAVLQTDYTTYTVNNFNINTAFPMEPETVTIVLMSWIKNIGPTGPVSTSPGPTGQQGIQGMVGPTGSPSTIGLAALRMTGGSQTVSNNTATTVTLDTLDIATTNSANVTTNTTTGLITCVSVGVYQVIGRINWTSTLGSGTYQLRILVNGSSTEAVNLGVSTPGNLGTWPEDSSQTVSAFINVVSADTTIGLQVFQNSGDDQIISGSGTVASYLFVKRVE